MVNIAMKWKTATELLILAICSQAAKIPNHHKTETQQTSVSPFPFESTIITKTSL